MYTRPHQHPYQHAEDKEIVIQMMVVPSVYSDQSVEIFPARTLVLTNQGRIFEEHDPGKWVLYKTPVL